MCIIGTCYASFWYTILEQYLVLEAPYSKFHLAYHTCFVYYTYQGEAFLEFVILDSFTLRICISCVYIGLHVFVLFVLFVHETDVPEFFLACTVELSLLAGFVWATASNGYASRRARQ